MTHKLTPSLQLALILLIVCLLSLAVFSMPARKTDDTKSALATPEFQRRNSLGHNSAGLDLSQPRQSKLDTVSVSEPGGSSTFFLQSVPSISSISPATVSPG